MKLAMVGLGKMGGNMVRRLCQGGIEVIGIDSNAEVRKQLAQETGMGMAPTVAAAVKKLEGPRVFWVMLPSGKPTEKVIKELERRLEFGDIVIDGGNSNYKDSQRRSAILAQSGIGFIDVGTSGGVWGLANGYCMMAGGEQRHIDVVEPILKVLAPAADKGWAHVGPAGAGHFTKMVHNGIEYGLMQAYAEGFDLMRSKREFNLDMAQVAEVWRHGSVVQSWLLDLTAEALSENKELTDVAPFVPDSGEGRWTVTESIDQGVPLPVISLALQMRFASQDAEGYSNKMLSVMRNAFGGHAIKEANGET